MNLTKKEREHLKGRISKARVRHDVTDSSLYLITDILKSSKDPHGNIGFNSLSTYLKTLVESV